jgi:Ca-activated chloride channel family protein
MRRLALLLIGAIILASCGSQGGEGTLPANAVEVSIVYGSEKKAWMDDVVASFNASGATTPDGKPIVVTATPMGSADSLNRILNGELKPTVWSPASTILVPVANQRWAQANSGAALVGDNPPQLVLSPVVIAMWEPMARALGWPEKPLGWTEIADLAASGKTWADFGRPEWGALQFGHTHPDYSNSGITSIIAIAYAATGKTRGLTVADVQDPNTAEFMQHIQSGVIHYGESTGFFGTQMFTRGPGYLSAAVLYENLVIESRDRERYPNLALPVAAIYPREGTFWSDHPYAILNAPWVDADQRAGAEVFQRYLLERPQQELALRYGFRPADLNVPLAAPIIAENGVDPQQPKTLLELPSADVIEAIRGIWIENKKRVDVMVVLDVSGSMEDEQRLEQAKSALRTFIGQLSDQDGLGVTVFSNEATVLSPISPVGPKRQELLDRIGGLVPQGGTRLLDTVQESYQTLAAEDPGQRIRAMVVLTDGLDNRSSTAPEQINALLGQDEEGRSIKVFTIAFGGDADTALLKGIADASGAKTYAPAPGEAGSIEQVYRDIATFF